MTAINLKTKDFKAHHRLMNWAVSLSKRQFIGNLPEGDYWWQGIVRIENRLISFGIDINTFLQMPTWQDRLLLEVIRYELFCHPWGLYLLHESGAYSELRLGTQIKSDDLRFTQRFKDDDYLYTFSPQECLLCHNRIPERLLLTASGDIAKKYKFCESCKEDTWKKGLARKLKNILPILADSNKFNRESLWSFYAEYVSNYLDPNKSFTPRGALREGSESEWSELAGSISMPLMRKRCCAEKLLEAFPRML